MRNQFAGKMHSALLHTYGTLYNKHIPQKQRSDEGVTRLLVKVSRGAGGYGPLLRSILDALDAHGVLGLRDNVAEQQRVEGVAHHAVSRIKGAVDVDSFGLNYPFALDRAVDGDMLPGRLA